MKGRREMRNKMSARAVLVIACTCCLIGTSSAKAQSVKLLVSSFNTWSILRFDGETGAFFDEFVPSNSGGLVKPQGLILGPDGNLYVSSRSTGSVMRYDGLTGAPLPGPNGAAGSAEFVPSGSGGLSSVQGLLFGPDDNLYVLSFITDAVLRYDGQTGAFIDAFIPPNNGGLNGPAALVFGPDENLYVSGVINNSILRYDGQTGAFIDAFVPVGVGGLNAPGALVFGLDGNLYVSSQNNSAVMRYDGQSGVPLPGPNGAAGTAEFVTPGSGGLIAPGGVVFGPDGSLYVNSSVTDSMLRYDGQNGNFIDVFVPAMTGGLDIPTFLIFDNDSDIDGVADVSDNCPFVSNTDQTDTDGDGMGNICDGCPNDPDNDFDGDGICGDVDNCPFIANPGQEDADLDGTGDACDVCPGFDDGIDSDGDGVPDGCDICPGFDDTLDTDGDSVPDCLDGCPNDPNKTDPGVCGCGVPDTDSDGDGALDCVDGCPNDPNKTDPGICGCGTPDTDTDSDGIADCLDLCPCTEMGIPVDQDGCPLVEACCFSTSGCLDLASADCLVAGGLPLGVGTTCATNACPIGACCFPNGTCGDNVFEPDCLADGGFFQGIGIPCSTVTCPPPVGACCLSNGGCLVEMAADCLVIPDSAWAGPGTDCVDANMNGRADDCESAAGDSDGDGIIDLLDNCPLTPNPTQTDADGDGVGNVCDACPGTPAGLSVDNAGRPRLDLNLDCLVNGQDIQMIVDELVNP